MPKSQKHRIVAEDLYRLQLLSSVRLSPDGRHAICSIQRVERKTEKKFANLWLVDVASGAARPFTYGDQKDVEPRWSPDGSQIAFLSNRGDADKPPQPYLIPFQGGEARPLATLPGEVGALEWSPDGKRLALSVRKFDPDQIERQNDEQKKKLGVIERHYDRLFYKYDGYGYLPHERWHIWTLDVQSGKTRQLTNHAVYDEQQPAWSPDGKWIALTSNRSADPDGTLDAEEIYLLPAGGGELRQLTAGGYGKSQPSFSPDGRWVAYYAQAQPNQGYRNTGIWLAPVDGSAPARNLLDGRDLHASAWTISDMTQPEQMPPTWSLDGRRVYFPVTQHGCSRLMSVQVDGGDLRAEIDGQGVVGSFSFDRAQTRLAYFYATLSDPGQVWVKDHPAGQPRRLTAFNRDWLDEIDLGTVEPHWIKGPDGNDLQGWIIKPPNFDPGQKYPSVLEIHGGPLTQYGFYFMHEFYYLAAQGFVVSFSNPRGGRGYGEAHAGAIWGQWGGVDYADLMAWADFVSSQPFIDPARMGVGGGSYGGYMTLWIIGHTQRFRAAVAMRVVSNFVSMWGSSDVNWSFQQELEAGAPFEDLQKYWEQSPIAYIGNARTPTLVIHNENDMRCPIEQGEQAYVALKRLGVETELVRFPDEFHGLSRNGRTDRRIARLGHIARWFKKYLQAG